MIFNWRKRTITRVTCPGCGVACDVATPPGDYKVDFRCGREECQQYVQPYVPNDEHAMYFVTKNANGDRIKHKIGSDSDPFSLEMYQRLNVGNAATSEEIRDAYNERRLALNPAEDPNLCIQNAAETAQVEEAFKLLSDSIKRRSYNKYGLTPDLVIAGEGGFDLLPDALNHMFGGGNFHDLVGPPILLPHILDDVPFDDDLQRQLEAESERIHRHLRNVLNQKLRYYNPDNDAVFRNVITLEAEHLRRHRNGLKLLHAVGSVYTKLGNLYAALYSSATLFSVLRAINKCFWQVTFLRYQFNFLAAKNGTDYNHAVAEERKYLAKRWRTMARRQQLKERCLRLLDEKYWLICNFNFEMRIVRACLLVFEVNRNFAEIGMLEKREFERKANALRIVGEIYLNQI